MEPIGTIYRHSLALLTDLYELTMAFGYWKEGLADHEGVFHVTYRTNPFGGAYAVACGLAYVTDFIDRFRFEDDDLAYLGQLRGADDRPLFDDGFLDSLRGRRLICDVDAVPEGTVVFAHEPLVRVSGPLIDSQILETVLLTIVNFQTLVATKAARVCHAAGDDQVLEFGLRRAQGIDGGLAASRAAYVGGCHATSNVLAGKLFDIPVRGTHAHSWVMCFDDERTAFEAYARALPNNCVFLVDTYDTIQGVRNAVDVGRQMRAAGHEMVGIRLDSGDLAELSIAARRMLDEAGLQKALIVASSELDEGRIAELKRRGATIGIWGVGTKLATAAPQAALGGVYKLAAIRPPGGAWQRKVKLSDDEIKISNPGIQQLRRYRGGGQFTADVIYDVDSPPRDGCTMVELSASRRRHVIADGTAFDDLLVPVMRGGRIVYDPPTAGDARRRALEQLSRLPGDVRRLERPAAFAVGLESSLDQLKRQLIQEIRARRGSDGSPAE